jgi:hypothetical protein
MQNGLRVVVRWMLGWQYVKELFDCKNKVEEI